MSTADVIAQHIVIDPEMCGGKPHITGRRITVQQVAFWHERHGMGVDEIATTYDLSLGDVYAALAYYHDHRAAIDAATITDDALIDALRERAPSKLNDRSRG